MHEEPGIGTAVITLKVWPPSASSLVFLSRHGRPLGRLRGPIADGKIITDVNEIKMHELLKGVLDYARVHCKESTFHEYEDKIRKHLLPFFASYRAVDICLNEQIITRFLGEKKDKG